MYVPSFFEVAYHDDGLIKEVRNTHDPEKTFIQKRIVKKLPKPVTNFLVPNVKVVNERAVIEIMRGCSRGCRFCQAGIITRPVRERPAAEILEALEKAIESTGYEEISLLSLSSFRPFPDSGTHSAGHAVERITRRQFFAALPAGGIVRPGIDCQHAGQAQRQLHHRAGGRQRCDAHTH